MTSIRIFYSYVRLFFASCVLLVGLALVLPRSPAAVARDARWRSRQLQTIPTGQQAQWIEERDTEDARCEAHLRIFGVLLGGMGLAAALRETAYLAGKYSR
jgi:hypothetical protein